MEYIKNIEIKNFKSIRHQTIDDCRRINVFIGYPNVGKSNILEALGLYSFLVFGGRQQFSLDDICRVEKDAELFYNQDINQEIQVILNYKTILSVDLEKEGGLSLDIKSEKVNFSEKKPVSEKKIDSFDIPDSFSKENLLSVKKYDFKKNVFLKSMNIPSFKVPNGNNLLDMLQAYPDLRRNVIDYFKEYNLKLVLDRADDSIKFQKELGDNSVVSIPYNQVADTLQRLIFYKTVIETNEETALLFEEPEAHMFPPYISKLTADIVYDENKNQYFITTHSPFVLNDFMEDADNEDLSVYVVGYKKDTGETIVRRISDEEKEEIYQYGVDLFFNLENYLKDAV
ncbi:MAG: AAA family ATPase [Chitinophagaceae bacterium]|nr:AAA family ATPase [Chitinophagaceae bacterium]